VKTLQHIRIDETNKDEWPELLPEKHGTNWHVWLAIPLIVLIVAIISLLVVL
jgi:hypothetical protein